MKCFAASYRIDPGPIRSAALQDIHSAKLLKIPAINPRGAHGVYVMHAEASIAVRKFT